MTSRDYRTSQVDCGACTDLALPASEWNFYLHCSTFTVPTNSGLVNLIHRGVVRYCRKSPGQFWVGPNEIWPKLSDNVQDADGYG